jgi:hypothetical protein
MSYVAPEPTILEDGGVVDVARPDGPAEAGRGVVFASKPRGSLRVMSKRLSRFGSKVTHTFRRYRRPSVLGVANSCVPYPHGTLATHTFLSPYTTLTHAYLTHTRIGDIPSAHTRHIPLIHTHTHTFATHTFYYPHAQPHAHIPHSHAHTSRTRIGDIPSPYPRIPHARTHRRHIGDT